eukprot:Sspe_Gene.98306::Locus_71745_Transcript_1_1_Confidence_1.000_Length_1452::g.98306::m.98306
MTQAEVEDLRRKLKERDEEIQRLRTLVARDLCAPHNSGSESSHSPTLPTGGPLPPLSSSPPASPSAVPLGKPSEAPLRPITSCFVPTWLRQLSAPEVKCVALVGCGGGFDFIQAMLLYPELRRMGKQVIIVSNSFTDVTGFVPDTAPIVWENGGAMVKRVTATSMHISRNYMPEVHLCSFLDSQVPDEAPNFVYACNARRWCIPSMTAFLMWLCSEHQCGAVVTVDGGTDSLMRGDEGCLGHPIEDVVTVASLAALGDSRGHRRVHMKGIDASLSDEVVLDFARQSGPLTDARLAGPRQGKRGSRKMRYGTFEFATHEGAANLVKRSGTQLGRFVVACEWDRGEAPVRLLLIMNFGADRVAGVTDASSLRAVSELIKAGGYRGCLGLESNTPAFAFYSALLDHMDSKPPGPGYFRPHPDARANITPGRTCREALHHAEAMCTLACAVDGDYGALG